MKLNFFTTTAIFTNKRTGEDIEVIVTTRTDRFADVAKALAGRRPQGFELFETF